MIVLDTNVISELARPKPKPQVIEWMDAQDSADLVITAATCPISKRIRLGGSVDMGRMIGARKLASNRKPRMSKLIAATRPINTRCCGTGRVPIT